MQRTQATANALIHDVKARLAPDCLPVFSSDGLRMYFYALTAHFGCWTPPPEGKRAPRWQVDPGLLFAQLIKVRLQAEVHQDGDTLWRTRRLPCCAASARFLRQDQNRFCRTAQPDTARTDRAVVASHLVDCR
jgi:hypothetical protein